MKIVSVEDGFEQAFWNLVNQDPLNYYFFIFDWKYRRDQSRFLLSIEDQRIVGAALVYSNRVVQLRGSRKAVRLLLNSVDLERAELQAPMDCKDILLEKYRANLTHMLILMCLKKGEESLQINHAPVKLGIDDAEEIVEILRNADPEFWRDIDATARHWEDAYILGIKRNDKLISIGLTRLVDFGSNISAIATAEGYRNMGFATSIVSALVQEILSKSQVALIHVLSENEPAVRVYSKVGFKPYKQYVFLQGEKIKDHAAP